MDSASHLADGAPSRAATAESSPPGFVDGVTRKVASRIRTVEGLRGYSVRAAVAGKYATLLVLLVACAAVTHWAFQPNPTWRMGGYIMLFAAVTMLVTAALGTILYADMRDQILSQMKHYVYGIVLFPGTALALFMRLVIDVFDAPAAQADVFVSVLTGPALPLTFAALVTVPTFLFVKYIFGGLRAASHEALTDEEQAATWQRQDGLQR